MNAASTTFKKNRQLETSGVKITITPDGFQIDVTDPMIVVPLTVEIYRDGKKIGVREFGARETPFKFSHPKVDPSSCGVRVLNGPICLCMVDVEEDPYPFMRPQGEQQHVTENYVSVPPALTITDEYGAVWTLGMKVAPKHKAPDGEFAFAVLRNGINTGEIASRIERRSGKVKIFTAEGWKTWTGANFF